MFEIIGPCVFRNHGDGCLSAKYVNRFSPPFGETCHLLPTSSLASTDPFIGTFRTVWLEQVNDVINFQDALLQISLNANKSYDLSWSTDNNQLLFTGIGMMYDDLLTCAYWNNI